MVQALLGNVLGNHIIYHFFLAKYLIAVQLLGHLVKKPSPLVIVHKCGEKGSVNFHPPILWLASCKLQCKSMSIEYIPS